MSIATCV
ncbi:hypothetical protein PENNAL_c0106G11637 [Penicillium nalgiovense]|nr:hypothetical protein PENNAL_c0106G11637 [Penicillium nalgiovense]